MDLICIFFLLVLHILHLFTAASWEALSSPSCKWGLRFREAIVLSCRQGVTREWAGSRAHSADHYCLCPFRSLPCAIPVPAFFHTTLCCLPTLTKSGKKWQKVELFPHWWGTFLRYFYFCVCHESWWKGHWGLKTILKLYMFIHCRNRAKQGEQAKTHIWVSSEVTTINIFKHNFLISFMHFLIEERVLGERMIHKWSL